MKKVIIIGGGFCGTQCAIKLEKLKDIEVTLIDNKPYFEYTPSVLRTILEPEHCKVIQANHDDYLKKANFINGEVVEINDDQIILKNGNRLEYDYLVIASGSGYATPIKEEGLIPASRAKELTMYHKALEQAENVLIIGGGPVGVELAAEICTHYKNKDITLVHSHSELMGRNHKKTREYSEKFLKKHGVNIVFNEKVKNVDMTCGKKKRFITNKGRKILTDFSFITVGIVPNFKLMKKNFSDLLDDRNLIKVDKYLRLKGKKNIFVGGDICSIKEEKTAQTAEKHSKLIVKNIKNILKGKELIPYESQHRPMVVSLGKYDGVFEGKLIIKGKTPAFMKWIIEKKTMRKYKC